MEQGIPGFTLEELVDDDPIVETSERAGGGDHRGARRILAELLMLDLRCLDAHAHLGNFARRLRHRAPDRHPDRRTL